MSRRTRNCRCLRMLAILAIAAAPQAVSAQADDADCSDHGHSHGLHFSHPLFTESVSPDTKVRFDFGRVWESEGNETELELEAEFAIDRTFSVEIVFPYTFLQPDEDPSTDRVGNLEIALKFANFAFEDHGILLGYGVEFGLPTGDQDEGIGSDHLWEIAPFLNIGAVVGGFEFVTWTRFGIPVNQNAAEEVETEFQYDFSTLYHVSNRIEALLELNGEAGLSGGAAGSGTIAIAPGVKVAPFADSPLLVGAGVSIPLTHEERDASLKIALFWHF